MLKTGIISSAYFGLRDYSSGLELVKAHGYDCVDYQDFVLPDSELYSLGPSELKIYLGDLKRAADGAGVSIWQMHGMWPHDDATAESRAAVVERHKFAIRAAGELGCKYFVIHPPLPYGWGIEPSLDEVYDLTAERFVALLPVAKDSGVVLCIENMPFCKGHSFSTIKEVKDFVRKIGDPGLKVCFDTGHCNVVGESQYDAIKTLGDDIACLHVHDDINRQDRHLIPYQGEIDWDDVIRALGETDFSGCVSLETAVMIRTPEPMREQMRLALSGIARSIADAIPGKNNTTRL